MKSWKNTLAGCGMDVSGSGEGQVPVGLYTVMHFQVPKNAQNIFDSSGKTRIIF